MWDSVDNEHLEADGALHPRRAVVSNSRFMLELFDLAHVTAFGHEGGDNTKAIHNAAFLDLVLETVGNWREVKR